MRSASTAGRKILLAFVIILVWLGAAVAINTLRQGSRQLQVAPVAPPKVDSDAVAARLAGALRFRTISYDDRPDVSADQFLALHAYLQQHYPLAHTALQREIVNDYSLLYAWQGSDSTARPIMLMAHQDVVPIAPGTEKDWKAGPFDGVIRDGFVWGRGAWDNKGNLLAMMEAVETLLAQGFQPRQTVYFVFGHDEENGGARGAQAIAGLLQARGVRLDFVLDEGFPITQGVMPGVAAPVALVGTAEKGMVTLELSATAPAGHSSMPAPRSAIGTLSKALARLEASPMRAGIRGVTGEMFDALAPEMGGFARVALSNRWLFGPLLDRQLQKTPSTNAMLRTTTALTVINAGNKANVLPPRAEALVNFRILPGDSAQSVLAHAKAVIADDAVKISISKSNPGQEPSRTSRSGSPAFRLIERTVRETMPGTLVAPVLVIGGTDARHMQPLADNVYRMTPMLARKEDTAQFHGNNERISIAHYGGMIGFYTRLLVNATGSGAVR